MEMPVFTLVLYILITLTLSAFFSGMEIAFVSASKLKVELDKKQGQFQGKILSYLFQRPKKLIGAMLVGNNVALVVYGILMSELIMHFIARFAPNIHLTIGTTWLLLLQTIISTIVVLVFAEFLPKTIFRINPNKWLNAFAVPLLMAYYILYIFSAFVTWLSKGVIRRFFKGDTHNEDAAFGRVDLDHYLKEATEKTDTMEELEHEIQIFQNALDFSSVKARECMIPRNEIKALDIEDSIETLTQTFVENGLSKILIYRDSIDNIIGYVHSYELFKKPERIKEILLPIIIVPEPMAANEVLELFIQQRRNMAVVVDEFGGTSGIITMEDIIEEIFGEIEDEHDIESLTEEEIDENTFIFSARLEIDTLNEKYNLEIPKNDEYDTLGGFIISHHADIPEEKEIIHIENFEFTILKVAETRIDLVELKIRD